MRKHPPNRRLPPWERPGCIRRDCEPHRVVRLHFLMGCAGGCCIFSICPLIGAAPALLALVFGCVVWVMTVRDLDAMLKGRMDPAGWHETWATQTAAAVSIVIGAVFLTIWVCVYLVIWGV